MCSASILLVSLLFTERADMYLNADEFNVPRWRS